MSAWPVLDPHPCLLEEELLLKECELRFTKRTGPGGQHRNKSATAVVLHHLPTQITAEASERRSQAQNRSVAIHRLRIQLALLVRSRWPDSCQPDLNQSSNDENRVPENRASFEKHPSQPAAIAAPTQDDELPPPAPHPLLKLWPQRMLDTNKFVSAEHWDYPLLVNVAVDALVESGFQFGPAADRLRISSGRLSRLLRSDGMVMAWINQPC